MRQYKLLVFLVLLGAFLRWINLSESMQFLYDQGRDALAAQKILSGDLVLVGPTTDMPGLFFGPLWYYLMAGLYAIAFGNPVIVTVLLSLLDLATIILIYIAAAKFFGKSAGRLAAFFWAVGALPVAYARTLCNPSTTAFWVLLVILALVKVREGKERWLILAFFTTALLFQFNAAAAFFFSPAVLATTFLLRRSIKSKAVYLWAFLAAATTFLPQVLFDLRYGFWTMKAVLKMFSASATGYNFMAVFVSHWQNFLAELSDYTFFGQKLISFGTLAIAVLAIIKSKPRYLPIFWSWLIIPLVIYFFLYPRGEVHPFYLLAWVPVAVISLANLTDILWKKFAPAAVVLLGLFVVFNGVGLNREIFLKRHFAQPQSPNNVGIGDQLRVVDYMYKNTSGPFGYYAYTIIPYWADEAWQYLFSWYGKNKYGYVPKRHGGNPVYLISEPDPYLPEMQKKWLADFRNPGKRTIVSKVQIGDYLVEKYGENTR